MTKVSLLKKPISKGRHTLYLDFYPPIPNPETGKLTRREFLKLYLLDRPKTEVEKNYNKETKQLARDIAAERQLEVNAKNYGFFSKVKHNSDFVQYFSDLALKKEGGNSGNWLSSLNYLKDFTGGQLRFADLTEHFCNDFREYLLTAPSKRSKKKILSQNSAQSYFIKFKAALKHAYKEGYLSTNLEQLLEPIKLIETQKNVLTIEELELLYKTECPVPEIKRAAIFSALTGLRISDILKLIWKEVRKDSQEYSLHFMQKKTKGQEVLPISNQAHDLLGEHGKPDDLVFKGLKYSAYNNERMRKWILKA